MRIQRSGLAMGSGQLFTNALSEEFYGFIHRVSADQQESGMTSTANNLWIVCDIDEKTSTISRGDTLECENGESYYVIRDAFKSMVNNLMRIYVKRL
jgi:hypothetical protein